jgi:protein NRD1
MDTAEAGVSEQSANALIPAYEATQPESVVQMPVSTSIPSVSSAPVTGLYAFDFATFDFTNPSSWTALGQAWKVTNGYEPNQEQLMQFVMSGGPQALQNADGAQVVQDANANAGGAPNVQMNAIPNAYIQQWPNNHVQEPLQQIGVYGDGMQQGSGMTGTGLGGGYHRAGRGGGRGRGNFRRNWDDQSAYSGAQGADEFAVGILDANRMQHMNGY